MKRRVLVVEDDKEISRVLELELSHEGFDVKIAVDGYLALKLAREISPHVILLDIMLPKLDGLSVARLLRSEGISAGIIVITAKTSIDEKLKGFEAGIDDYVTKPFEIEEIIARINALLKRMNLEASIKIGDLEIKNDEMRVFVKGQEIFLTPTEFRLLQELALSKGAVLSKEELLERVWGFADWENPNVVEVYVNYLRKKLGDASFMIKTIRGSGYALRKD